MREFSGSELSILTQFLSNRSQHVVVNCCRSKLGKCIGSAVLPPVRRRAFHRSGKQALRLCWQLHFGGCCAIPRWESSCYRVRIVIWTRFVCGVTCREWNWASMSKNMIVSRSRTIYPQTTPFTLDGTVLKESADLVILGGRLMPR